MCVWCERYGEGDKWFFNPANYSRRLYRIRKEEAEAAGADDGQATATANVGVEIREAQTRGDWESVMKIRTEAEEKAWRTHFGQVVTLDEALKIADVMYPIAKMACDCRRNARGWEPEENFTCVGMGPGMYKWERWPNNYPGGVEFITPEQLKDLLRKFNRQGLVHTVATFGTPYLGGFCNCDYPDCVFMRDTLDHGIRKLWKGHYVAKLDPMACNGCADCIKRCQFRALSFNTSRNIAHVNMMQCFGCGLCETECRQAAITMVDRAELPALAEAW